MKPQTQSKQEITERKFANPERVKVAKSKVFPLILPILPKQTNEPKKTKNQKNKKTKKKTKKTKKTRLHTPTLCIWPPPLGVCNLVFFFFVFLVWVVNAHVPSRIARHCQWLQRSACGRCFGRTGEISGRTLLFATFTLSGFANLCSIISCFGSLVLLENHVKTREKCMYFWGELKALGPGVGNSVIEVFWTYAKRQLRNKGNLWVCRTHFDIGIIKSKSWINTCSNNSK